MKQFVLGLSILGLSAVGVAKECSYEMFRPQFLTQKILYDFNQAGLGQIGFRSADEKGIEVNKTTLVRDTGAVGVVEFQKDARNQAVHFVVRDVRGRTLLSVVEEKRGVSRTEIEFYSDFQHYKDMPFLTILHFPAGGTYHYVGVKDEGITLFYSLFQEAWLAAKQVVLGETSPTYFFFKSAREKFLFRAQNNPALTPYVSLLSVNQFGKNYRVTGVVPSNYAYHLVLRLAQEELGISTRVDLTIDQRIRVPEMVNPTCR